MLKEVYLLENGINMFHYSENDDIDETSLLLASGFMSAIQSFSQEARASSIDFFASDIEFFIFDKIDGGEKQLIAIFSNSMEYSVGREVMRQLKRIILSSPIIESSASDIINNKLKRDLKDRISRLANNTKSIEFQIEAASDLFEESSEISLLILHDYNKNKTHFSESRPENLFNDNQLVALRSIHRYFKRLVRSLNFGDDMESVKIESDEYSLSIFKHKSILTLCFSLNPNISDHVHEIPMRTLSFPDYHIYNRDFENLNHISTLVIDEKENLEVHFGENPSWKAEKLIVKSLLSINRLLASLNQNQFHNITIFVSNPKFASIKLKNKFTTNELYFDTYN